MKKQSRNSEVAVDGVAEDGVSTEPFAHRRIKQKKFVDPVEEAMVSLMVAASELNARIAQICEARGVTVAQYNVLRILRGVHPEGHPRYEISSRMIDRAPDVTRLIDRLERHGLVERVRSARDMRLSISRITSRGLELLEQVQPDLDVLYRSIGERLPIRDRQALGRICQELFDDQE
jgi:DNA-binding MarR family transcriptional regulator